MNAESKIDILESLIVIRKNLNIYKERLHINNRAMIQAKPKV